MSTCGDGEHLTPTTQGRNHHRRFRFGIALLYSATLGAIPATGYALGLGPLTVTSHLGEPLRASAPILVEGRDSLKAMRVAVASQADYQMVGQTRAELIDQLQVRLVEGPPPKLQLTSSKPIKNALFEALIRLENKGNELLKQYTVAVEPLQGGTSTAADSRAAGPSNASTTSESSRHSPSPPSRKSAVVRPKVQVTENWAKRNRYGPIQSGDTLMTIARRVRRDDTVPLAVAVTALAEKNPQALRNGNMNRLKRGAILEIPQDSELDQYSLEEARRTIIKHRQRWLQQGTPRPTTRPGHARYPLHPAAAHQSQQSGGAPPLTKTQGGDPNPGPDPGKIRFPAGAPEERIQVQAASARGPSKSTGSATRADPPTKDSEGSSARLTKVVHRLQELSAGRSKLHTLVTDLKEQVSRLDQRIARNERLHSERETTLARLVERIPSSLGSRDQANWMLWALAAVNLFILGTIAALWWRLQQFGEGEVSPSELETGEGDPTAESSVSAPRTSQDLVATTRFLSQGGALQPLASNSRLATGDQMAGGSEEGLGATPTQEAPLQGTLAETEGGQEFELELLRPADPPSEPEDSTSSKPPWEELEWESTLGSEVEPQEVEPTRDQAAEWHGENGALSIDSPLDEAGQEEISEVSSPHEGARSTEPEDPEQSPASGEAGIKLDIARAYIEVGELDTARSLLQEVLAEGDTPSQQQAHSLLASID